MAGDALTQSFFSEKNEGRSQFLAKALLSIVCSTAVLFEENVVRRDGGKPPSRGDALNQLHNPCSSSPFL